MRQLTRFQMILQVGSILFAMSTSFISPDISSAESKLKFEDGNDATLIRCVITKEEESFYQANSGIDPFIDKLYINRANFENGIYVLEVKTYKENRSYPLLAIDTGENKELFSALQHDCRSLLRTKTRKPLKNGIITITAQEINSAANIHEFCNKKQDCIFFARQNGKITDFRVQAREFTHPNLEDGSKPKENTKPNQNKSLITAQTTESTNGTPESHDTKGNDNISGPKSSSEATSGQKADEVKLDQPASPLPESPSVTVVGSETPYHSVQVLVGKGTQANGVGAPVASPTTGGSYMITILKYLALFLFALTVTLLSFLGLRTLLLGQKRSKTSVDSKYQTDEVIPVFDQEKLIGEMRELLNPFSQMLYDIKKYIGNIPIQSSNEEVSQIEEWLKEIKIGQARLSGEFALRTKGSKENLLQLENENNQLKEKIEDYKSQLSQATKELQENHRDNQDCFKTAQEATKSHQELLKSNNLLTKKITSIQSVKAKLVGENETLTGENNTLKGESDILTKRIRKKEEELKKVTKQLEKLTKGIIEEKGRISYFQKQTVKLAYERPVMGLLSATDNFLRELSRKENQSTQMPGEVLKFLEGISAFREKSPAIELNDYPLNPWKTYANNIFSSLTSIDGRKTTAAIFNLTYWYHWIGLHENIQKEAKALMDSISNFYVLQGYEVHGIELDDHIPETALESQFKTEEFYLNDTEAYQLGLRKAYRKLLGITVEQNRNLLEIFRDQLDKVSTTGRRSSLYQSGFSRDFLRLEVVGYSSHDGGKNSSKPKSLVI